MSSTNATSIDLLSAVNHSRENWTILVRVVRLWRVADIEVTKPPLYIESVLVDAEVVEWPDGSY